MTRLASYTLLGALALTFVVAGCSRQEVPPEMKPVPKNIKIAPPPASVVNQMKNPPAPKEQAPAPAPAQGQ